MSTLPNSVYANPSTPCFEPFGGGGGGLNPVVDSLTVNQGGTITLGSPINQGTTLTFNKALDGSTYSILAEAYLLPGNTPADLRPTIFNDTNNYEGLVAGTFYAHGNAVYGAAPSVVLGDLGTGVGLGYRDNAAIITPLAEVVMGPEFTLSNVKSINGNPYFPPAYGSFSSTLNQPISATTELPLVYDTADVTPIGMTCALPSSDITITESGTYKVLASVQCDRTVAGQGDVEMWCSVQGTAVPNSATRINLNQNIEQVMTVEWIVSVAASEIVSVSVYSSVAGNVAASFAAAPPVPAIPSIITTVLRIA